MNTDGWTTRLVGMIGECPHCSGAGISVLHSGKCPKVASVEYNQNGTVKKVAFHEEPKT